MERYSGLTKRAIFESPSTGDTPAYLSMVINTVKRHFPQMVVGPPDSSGGRFVANGRAEFGIETLERERHQNRLRGWHLPYGGVEGGDDPFDDLTSSAPPSVSFVIWGKTSETEGSFRVPNIRRHPVVLNRDIRSSHGEILAREGQEFVAQSSPEGFGRVVVSIPVVGQAAPLLTTLKLGDYSYRQFVRNPEMRVMDEDDILDSVGEDADEFFLSSANITFKTYRSEYSENVSSSRDFEHIRDQVEGVKEEIASNLQRWAASGGAQPSNTILSLSWLNDWRSQSTYTFGLGLMAVYGDIEPDPEPPEPEPDPEPEPYPELETYSEPEPYPEPEPPSTLPFDPDFGFPDDPDEL